jgi:hypothetical protein
MKDQHMEHIEIVKDGTDILAIIIRREYSTEGLKFFTPDEFSQQLAYMYHKKGKKIEPHAHNVVRREISFTQEVLFLKRGKLKVDLYGNDKSLISSVVLVEGDVILLAGGGHGFEAVEDIEMIEVKQGPYSGDLDKTYFKVES